MVENSGTSLYRPKALQASELSRPAFVGIGSNLADPQAQVVRALDGLGRLPECRLARASSLYRTRPWGEELQSDFINAVAQLDTTLPPEPLLDALQELEHEAGRVREGRRWGPRILDLDLLLYADHIQQTQRLTLPHPWLHRRAFVLVPLLEIAPRIEIPGIGTAANCLEPLDTNDVTRLAPRT